MELSRGLCLNFRCVLKKESVFVEKIKRIALCVIKNGRLVVTTQQFFVYERYLQNSAVGFEGDIPTLSWRR
jgi:hypothetical protein